MSDDILAFTSRQRRISFGTRASGCKGAVVDSRLQSQEDAKPIESFDSLDFHKSSKGVVIPSCLPCGSGGENKSARMYIWIKLGQHRSLTRQERRETGLRRSEANRIRDALLPTLPIWFRLVDPESLIRAHNPAQYRSRSVRLLPVPRGLLLLAPDRLRRAAPSCSSSLDVM